MIGVKKLSVSIYLITVNFKSINLKYRKLLYINVIKKLLFRLIIIWNCENITTDT